jgi:hypothetical protein
MSQLDSGVPKEVLSDRVDVSVPVLEKHYDQRSEKRKSRRRREELGASLPLRENRWWAGDRRIW